VIARDPGDAELADASGLAESAGKAQALLGLLSLAAEEVERTPSSNFLPSSYVDERWVSSYRTLSMMLK
jgi:hypothetical protein